MLRAGLLPFSHNPDTGVTTWWEDTDTGFRLHHVQDCEPIIELNKKKQSAGRDYYRLDDDMWRVASIPIVVQYEWLVRYGITDITSDEHWPKVRKLLNDPEWRYLKTASVII